MFTHVSYIRAEVYLRDLITLWQLKGNPLSEHGMWSSLTSAAFRTIRVHFFGGDQV